MGWPGAAHSVIQGAYGEPGSAFSYDYARVQSGEMVIRAKPSLAGSVAGSAVTYTDPQVKGKAPLPEKVEVEQVNAAPDRQPLMNGFVQVCFMPREPEPFNIC